jgi:hypothetical protein
MAFFQELFAQISSRVGFGAQEYLDDTGIILGALGMGTELIRA